MIEKMSFETFFFWLVVHPQTKKTTNKQKKSGQKSDNMDTGCLEYWHTYFGVGRSAMWPQYNNPHDHDVAARKVSLTVHVFRSGGGGGGGGEE